MMPYLDADLRHSIRNIELPRLRALIVAMYPEKDDLLVDCQSVVSNASELVLQCFFGYRELHANIRTTWTRLIAEYDTLSSVIENNNVSAAERSSEPSTTQFFRNWHQERDCLRRTTLQRESLLQNVAQQRSALNADVNLRRKAERNDGKNDDADTNDNDDGTNDKESSSDDFGEKEGAFFRDKEGEFAKEAEKDDEALIKRVLEESLVEQEELQVQRSACSRNPKRTFH